MEIVFEPIYQRLGFSYSSVLKGGGSNFHQANYGTVSSGKRFP